MLKEYPLEKAFMFIEPGPVVLVTTAHKGKANIMTMSWHMVLEFTPKFACIIGPWDYSFAALKATRQCVLAIPTVDLAGKVVEIGNCSGRDVDKFKKFGLIAKPASKVKAPLITECLANIECKVEAIKMADQYSLIILEGVKAWYDAKRKEKRTIHAHGDGTFSADGRALDLRKKMTKWKLP